jgi:hypothetical protein
MAKYFTLEEANALLPTVEPLMAELMERRARVVQNRHEVADIVGDLHSNRGSLEASYMAREFIAIEKLARRIRNCGCIIKDLNAGLLDFLAKRDGREVYLCWRFGEPRVEFFHELHTGFMSRERF